ncbi:MAG: hypothetical protein ACRD3M_00890 [Thermoanaerobaculia bacterium]
MSVFGMLLVLLAGQPAAPASASPIVVGNFYYAKTGKAAEVLAHRRHACDVLAKLGVPRGRVYRRLQGSSPDLPDVIWECEYPDAAARERALGVVASSKEFDGVMAHMQTLLRRFERSVCEEVSAEGDASASAR